MDSGTRIMGGGSGYAALLAHAEGVLYGMELGSVTCILYSVICLRGNGVIRRTRKVIQGDDNGHVGRPCEVSLAPPCPELFCELRGLCRHSHFEPRTWERTWTSYTEVCIFGGLSLYLFFSLLGLDQPLFATRWSCHFCFEILISF